MNYYFKNEIEFEGSFKLASLITEEELDKLSGDFKEIGEKKKEKERARVKVITNIAERIEKIRNRIIYTK